MLRSVVRIVILCALPMAAIAQDGTRTETNGLSGGTKAKELSSVAKAGELSGATKTKQRSGGTDAKELSGMSILGNDETAKALYIVPWKSSEIGAASDLRSGLLNDAMVPVDKEVFMRELEFYEISSHK
jgi:hypothetical protein